MQQSSKPIRALPFSSFFDLHRAAANKERSSDDLSRVAPAMSFRIASRRRNGRWQAMPLRIDGAWREPIVPCGGWRTVPHAIVGDAPDKYHPGYAMSLLSSRVPANILQSKAPLPETKTAQSDAVLSNFAAHEYSCNTETSQLELYPIPIINFSTAPEVRRSMTLNGMRMTTEYMQNDSPRVLQLVESRLEANQRDVVHDVLVYVMRQTIDVRTRQSEARDLRAESVAAYLGLDELRVRILFSASRLSALNIARRIEAGFAGKPRRALDIELLLRGQLAHLRPDLRALNHEEGRLLWLLDEIVARLFTDSGRA